MGGRKYTTDFKVEAARQVIDHGHPVREVAKRPANEADSSG